MKKELLYRDLAKYYDLIYHWKDYKKESDALLKLISKYQKSKGKNLLEAGCGTGHHLQFLKNKFKCVGTDINQGILNVAKEKNKGVSFKKEDMINMKLNQKFDIIISMFSSIGYVKTLANLKKTMQNFSNHLTKGGVIIIEPWFSPEKFNPGRPILHTYEDDNIKLARMSLSKRKGNLSTLHMDYLIAEKGKDIIHFKDVHELGLFETNKTLEIMKKAGLKSKFLKNGFMKDRGVFIGIKE
jgi:ubiquinone/menaquinone biosynthesis C-methylase UbiE